MTLHSKSMVDQLSTPEGERSSEIVTFEAVPGPRFVTVIENAATCPALIVWLSGVLEIERVGGGIGVLIKMDMPAEPAVVAISIKLSPLKSPVPTPRVVPPAAK